MKLYAQCMGRGDMLSFLLNLLLPIYIVISLGLVISHAKAIEHPARSNRNLGKERPIHVTVKPKTELDFYPGGEVIVACKAKGGKRVEETPFISFFREFEDTHMPLDSHFPGLSLAPQSVTDYSNEYRVKQLLTLNKNYWYLLDKGPNLFFCKATDMSGNTGVDYFVVNKKHHHQNHHQRNRTRRHRRIISGHRSHYKK